MDLTVYDLHPRQGRPFLAFTFWQVPRNRAVLMVTRASA